MADLPKCRECGRMVRREGERHCYKHRKRKQCHVCKEEVKVPGACPGCRKVLDDLHAALHAPAGPSVPRILERVVSLRGRRR